MDGLNIASQRERAASDRRTKRVITTVVNSLDKMVLEARKFPIAFFRRS